MSRRKGVRTRDIAVIGMACRFPAARDCAELWRNLVEGHNALSEIPAQRWDAQAVQRSAAETGVSISRWGGLVADIDRFDARFFGISPREAESMDPQQRMLLEETWHCVEAAGLPLAELQRGRTAVLVGAMTSDHLQGAVRSGAPPGSHAALGAYHGILANRLSHFLGLTGGSLAVDAAHAASLVALHQAVRWLQSGEADHALVAGVNALLDPWKTVSFSRARMLSPDGQCRPFDAAANGYVPGEGVGVVLLQPLRAALRQGNRVLGVIRGVAVNHNGSGGSLTAPSAEAQRRVILQACREAAVEPGRITYVEAHGTGTPLGDPVEIAALRRVYGRDRREAPCRVGSVKSSIGHLEAASGIAGLIKVLLMLEHRRIPRTLGVGTVNPALGLEGSALAIAADEIAWRPVRAGAPLLAGVSCFGFGGVNVHAVVQEGPRPSRRARPVPKRSLFLLSAKSEAALASLRRQWQAGAEEILDRCRLQDLCATLMYGRQHFPHRYGLVVGRKAELLHLLQAEAPAGDSGRGGRESRLLRRWLAGEETPWERHFPQPGYARLLLPLYPFERTPVGPIGAEGQRDAAPQEAAAAPRQGIADHLKTVLAAKLQCAPADIGEHQSFVEGLGVDSFINMEVLEALEADLGPLPRTLLFEHATVARLADHLGRTHAGARVPAGVAAPETPPPAAGHRPDDIAIIGLAGRFPDSPDVDALWDHLLRGESCIREVPPERWDLAAHHDPAGRDSNRSYTRWGGFLQDHDCFDPLFFQISPHHAEQMDPQQRVFLETAWAAMEDAGYAPAELPRDTGVFVGASTNTYGLWAAQAASQGEVQCPDTDLSDVANRVSYALDLRGPSLSVDTACSSSLTALHLAVQSLQRGECPLAFAGGVSLTLHPSRVLQFCRKEMLQRGPACHPFGAGEGGFVDGEGACVVLLKPRAGAVADRDHIYGVIKGTAVNSEGRTSGYTVPSPERQAALIGLALERSGVHPRTIGYVEAHGTGTRLGDPIEIAGLSRAYGARTGELQYCAIGSLKSNIGHLIAAAGIAGVAKVLLQMRHRTLVPSLHADTPNPYIDFARTPFRLQRQVEAWRPVRTEDGSDCPLRAGVSAFGSGGANAHVILEAWEAEVPAAEPAEGPFLIPLSARSPERLGVLAGRLADYLGRAASPFAMADIAYTLQVGRQAMESRAAFVVGELPALVAALRAYAAGGATVQPAADPALDDLARRWLAGDEVDWRVLYPHGLPRRISLPTYPFLRQRYWLPVEAPKRADRPDTLCYRPVWRPEPLPAMPPGREVCLVLAPEGPMDPQLAAGLPGVRLLWARPGSQWSEDGDGRWTLRPDGDDDYRHLLEVLAGRGEPPDRIVHLWARGSLQAAGGDLTGALESVYALLRALAGQDGARPVELVYAYPAGEPHYAAVGALLHAVHLERPRLHWRSLEWERGDREPSPGEVLALALAERGAPTDLGVRHAGGLRYVQDVALLAETGERFHYRPGGVYVITGGLGGLGGIFAEHLARQAPCRLALLGRSAPDARSQALLDALGTHGAEAVYLQADVCDPAAVEWALGTARTRYGAIHGLIHAAGSKQDGYLLQKSWDRVEASLRAKLQGTMLLDAATRDDPLDFFVACASIAAHVHGDGLADYACANAFLEHYAEWREGERRAGRRHGRSLAIAWPLWAQGGMTVPAQAEALMAEQSGLAALPTAAGLEAWESALGAASSRCIVLHGDPPRLAAALQARYAGEALPAPVPTTGGAELGPRCTAYLKGLIAAEAGLPPEQIDARTDVAAYGLDSVNLRRVIARLEAGLGPLAKSLLLEHPSVAELAEHLQAHHGPALAGLLGAEALMPAPARPPAYAGAPAAVKLGADDVAIVGIAGRYPQGPDLDALWDNLCAGRDCTTEVPAGRWDAAACYDPDPARAAEGKIYCRWGGFLEDVDRFDPLLFELTPLEAKTMHPEERLLLETAWSTLEDAGASREMLRGRPVGVYVGVDGLSYPLLGLEAWRRGGNVSLDASYYPLANRISYFFDLTGPSVPVDTGCSSSLVALHLACESIRAGTCEAALVGGVNLYLHPSRYWVLCRDRLAATGPGLRLYRRGADGFIPGEGVGMVYLKPLARAEADGDRIHGVIKASAVAYKGRSNGFLAPAPRNQAALLGRVLAQADIDPASVGYIEVQSAGSEMADSAEWRALLQAYGGAQRCAVGSVKPNIGHLQAAAGMAQLSKVLLQLRHGRIAPSLVAAERNEDVRTGGTPFTLAERLCDWPPPAPGLPRRAAITAAAAGGTEVHLVVEEHVPQAAPGPAAPGEEAVLLSARSPAQLRRLAQVLRDHLATGAGGVGLHDLAYTLRARRTAFVQRWGVVATDHDQLVDALSRYLDGVGGAYCADTAQGVESAPVQAPPDLRAAIALWVRGSKIDWTGLTTPGRVVSLPGYPFERRRCWLYEESGASEQAPPVQGAGAMVADYYDRMTDSLKAETLGLEDELYILFAPFPEPVPGFSWLKAFFDPARDRRHLDLMLAKQKELKTVLYRHVDFSRVRRVFDIGCGLATDLIQLARAHPGLGGEGFTITPRQAEEGAARIRRAGLTNRLRVHCADSTRRPFPGRYDLIIGFEVVFHIEDKQAVFANIAAHLAEDGYLILADGVTNTVTEIDMPTLGQFTATAPQLSRVLAHNGLQIQECVDASREIGNFLRDDDFEANLAAIGAKYPALQAVEHEHRCWDSFGKALGSGLVRYLLFTIRKASSGIEEPALAALNERRIAAATSYAQVMQRTPAAPRPAVPAAAPGRHLEDLETELVAIAGRVLELEPGRIDPGARYTDYGVGSLQGLYLLEAINRQLGLALKMHVLYDHSSLRDLSAHIRTAHGEALAARVAPRPAVAPQSDGVAVIGMAGRFPGTADLQAYWDNLAAGVDSVAEIPVERWDPTIHYHSDPAVPGRSLSKWAGTVADVDRFDAGLFRISPREAELMDPQQRLFLEACWGALEDAGQSPEAVRGSRCGVYAGVMGSDYQRLLQDSGLVPEAQMLLGTDEAILASRISYALDTKGPALTVKTACSSSLVAVHLACGSLLGGEADLMLAGGVTLYLDHRPFVLMSKAGMLSPTGRCRPFDDGADGIAVGDGVGVVVLKRLSDALRDGDPIHGVIRASGMNQDGRTNGITAPSMESQKALELAVYRDGGIDPATIGYVEAHGTGTRLGDPIEVQALTEAFRAHTDWRQFCALGSVKGNIGHTTAAAGIAGLIKVLLALRHRLTPPTLHVRRPNRHIELASSPFYLNTEPSPWQPLGGAPRRAAVSAFAYNGTNSHLIVDEAPPLPPEPSTGGPRLVPLSARDGQRLREYARRLADYLGDRPELDLAAVAHTLQTGRSAMDQRLAVVAASMEDLSAKLAAYAAGDPVVGMHQGRVEPGASADGPDPADLAALAAHWVSGGRVDWSALHPGHRPRRLSLPGYPFARERYWIPDGRPATPAASQARLACYRPIWREASPASGGPAGPVLLLCRDADLRDTLAIAGLQGMVLALPGEAYAAAEGATYTLRPGRADDYRALLAALAAGPGLPRHIVYDWASEVGDAPLDPNDIRDTMESVYRLSRALLAQGPEEPVQLLYLEVGTPSPLSTAMAAYARTVQVEHPRLRWRTLAVPDRRSLPKTLAGEWAAADAVEVSHHGGRRRIRDLEPLALAEPTEPPLREGGVYLITGGAGALGMILAEHLAGQARVALVLCGRSAVGPEIECRLDRLRALGATAHYLQADVCRREDVARLVSAIKARHGRIDGIVHAAGLVADAPLAHKDPAAAAEVLAPKVGGTVHLDRATREEPLDFLVLCSSIAAVAGNPGQADYACANGFLDGYAEWRERARAQGRRRGRTLSVAWPLWAEGGMRVSAQGQAALARRLGMQPMPTALGLQAWGGLLALDCGARAAVIYGEPEILLQAARALPETATPARTAAGDAVTLLRRLFAEHLHCPLDQIAADTPFEDLGIDSIMINAINQALEARLGPLAKTLLFEYQTIAALAGHLATSHGTVLKQEGAAAAAAPPPAGQDIAIIGISGRYPGAPDLDALWDMLASGRDGIAEIPAGRWDHARYYDPSPGDEVGDRYYCKWGGFLEEVDCFDPLFFGISPREAERMDPQERLFLQTAWATFEDAGYTPGRVAGQPVGVYVGVTSNTYALWGPEAWRAGETVIPESMPWSIANRVSYYFDLHGPSLPVDTACSSSLYALHLACEGLRRGECAMALVGGVNLYLHPAKYVQLSQLRMLSPTGRCHSFGAGGDGFVPGEGVGAVLLKPLADALADGDRIEAVIKGSAVNHGGRTNGYTVPSPQSQAALIGAALRAAGVEPATLGYVEAHGTGTALGDPVEVEGLTRAFQGAPGPCAMGSVKSNLGHLEAAAGMAGLSKLVLQLRHRRLVASLHAETLNPNIDFERTPFRVQRRAAEWLPPRGADGAPLRAGISSFGAGGANAHVILEQAPAVPPPAVAAPPHLYLISARSEDRLRARVRQMARALDGMAGTESAAVAYTLQIGRASLAERLAVIAEDLHPLRSLLEAYGRGEEAGPALRRGSVRAGLVADPDQVDALLRSRDLEGLAQAWLSGAAVDWGQLYPAPRPRPLALPTYPFAGKRYWVGQATAPEPGDTIPLPAMPRSPAQMPGTLEAAGLMSLLLGLEAGELSQTEVKRALER